MADLSKSLREMTEEEVQEYVGITFKAAYGQKLKDMDRNERYLNIYQALDSPDDRIDEDEDLLEEDVRIYSDTYLPIGAARVDTATANIYNAFFSTPDYFEIVPGDPADFAAAQRIRLHMMKRHREMKFRHTVFQTILSASCFDYAVTLMRWKVKPGMIPTRKTLSERVDFAGVVETQQRIEIVMERHPAVINRTNFELLDFFNCWHDYNAKNGFEDSEYFFDRRYELFQDMVSQGKDDKNVYGKYTNLDQVKTKLFEHAFGSRKDMTDPNQVAEAKIGRSRVEIIRCWTWDHVVEMVDDIVVSRQDIFGWPLQQWKMYNIPGNFKGMGILQRIERMQHDVNAQQNQERDYWNLVNNPIAIVDEQLSSMNEGKVNLYPGKVLLKSGSRPASDFIHFHQPGVNAPSAGQQQLALTFKVFDEITGMGPPVMGQETSGRTSAREISVMSAGAGARFITIARNMEETGLEPAYQMQFLLESMFMKQPDSFAYMGKYGLEWPTVTPADYKWSAVPRFMARGTTTIRDKEIHMVQFQTSMDRAFMMPALHDWREIFSEMWRLSNPDDYQRFLINDQQQRENIPPAIENQILIIGHSIKPSPMNNHEQHIGEHQAFMGSIDYQTSPPPIKKKFEDHIAAHQQMATQMSDMAGQMQNQNRQRSNPTGNEGVSQISQGIRGAQLGITP